MQAFIVQKAYAGSSAFSFRSPPAFNDILAEIAKWRADCNVANHCRRQARAITSPERQGFREFDIAGRLPAMSIVAVFSS